jgi:hypothetical protein
MKASGLAAGAALVALLLAGCGGDNSPSATPAATSATTSGGSSQTTASGGGDASTTSPSFSGSGNSDFCGFAKDLENSDLANGLTGENADLKGAFTQLNDALSKAEDKAPSEIKADIKTMGDAFKQYSDVLAKYDYDVAKLTAAAQKDPQVLAQATALLSDPKVEEASTRVTAYAEQVCGITTDTTS